MWRLLIIVAIVVWIIFFLIFSPGRVLRLMAMILYSSGSPLGRDSTPVWASYFLGKGVFEGEPAAVRNLEEILRTLGYALLAVPVSLAVAVALLGN